MLEKGDRVPRFEIVTIDDIAVNYADVWQKKNLALVCLPEDSSADAQGYIIHGSPATVRQKLDRYQKELGMGVVLTGCQIGGLQHELTRKSMEMFAREVIPHFRPVPPAPVAKEGV